MFGSSNSGGNATALQGVQINSSDYGNPLPIVYGQARVGTTCIWYNNFQAAAQQQGGKGGGGATSYSYTAAVMLALCEGTCGGVGNIYKDRTVITLSNGQTPIQQDSLTFSGGAQGQAVWSYLTATYPAQALAYSGTAWLANSNMQLDSSAGIPNYNVEVFGLFQSYNGYNNRGTWSSSNTYAAEDYVIDPGNGLPYLAMSQVGPTGTAPSADGGVYWTLIWNENPDTNLADVIPDLLTNSRYGAYFPSSSIADMTALRTYTQACGFFFSPVLQQQVAVQQQLTDWCTWANCGLVWSQGQLKIIPYGDMPVTGYGATFTPSNGAVYNFSDTDYIANTGDDPIQIQRVSPSDAYNNFKLEWLDRSNNYNTSIAEVIDQSAVDLYGLRTQGTITAHDICIGRIAQTIAQLQLQRSLYIRNTYTFTVGFMFCPAEPMDVVTVTDSTLGFNALPVRITGIEEDDNFNLKITAEDFIVGVGTAIAQARQPNLSSGQSVAGTAFQADPGNVSTPQFFNMPAALITTQSGGFLGLNNSSTLQLGVAVVGTSPNWGGCQMWVSLDGTTYKRYATLLSGAGAANKQSGAGSAASGSARYGVLTADFPLHADPDTSDTLSLDLSASHGSISSATSAQAGAAATLSLLGGTECVSYTTATLTSGYAYNCTGTIRRGQASTPITDHPIGSSFIRLDDSILKYNYLNEQIGTTIHIKFLSFNLFGFKTQNLADVTDYTVTLTPATAVPSAVTGLIEVSWIGTVLNISWNASLGATSYTVQIYKSDGTTLLRTVSTAGTAFAYTLADATADGDIERTYVIKVTAASSAGSSAAASLTVNKPAPAAETGLSTAGSGTSVTASWGANAAIDLGGYLAWYSTTNGFTPPGAGTQFYSGSATSVILPGLTPGTPYYMRVAAFDQWSSDPTALNFSAQYGFTP